MLDLIIDAFSAVSAGGWLMIVLAGLALGYLCTWLAVYLWNVLWYKKNWEQFYCIVFVESVLIAAILGISVGSSELLRKREDDVVREMARISFNLPAQKPYKDADARFERFAYRFVNTPTWSHPYFPRVYVDMGDPMARKLYQELGRELPEQTIRKLIGWMKQVRIHRPLDATLLDDELEILKSFFIRWHFRYAHQKCREALESLTEISKWGLLLCVGILAFVSVSAYKDIHNPPIKNHVRK